MTETFAPSFLDSPTGARLAVRILEAKGTPRGIILINHGLAEHAGRYESFARFLSARGFHVSAHDHRGHGKTTSPDSQQGVFATRKGWDKVIADVSFMRTHLQARFGDLPLIVFGHSMGGVVAMNLAMAEHREITGLAVWNANLAVGSLTGLMRIVLGIEGLFKKQTAVSTWLNALTFDSFAKAIKKRRTRSDWLSRIPEEVDQYIADPECGWFATISLWRDLVTGIERGQSVDRLEHMRKELPVHLVGGGCDPATDGAKATKALAERMRLARFSDLTLRIDPEARHETLNDLGREQAMEDFAVWAERVVAG